jgi:orotidine-5'-phosphate decarboxylase
VFLDLKLHDIPSTVSGAVLAAAALEVELLTVHATGGGQMLAVASEAAGPKLKILAVTILTSLAAHEVGATWGREIRSLPDEVVRLASLAAQTGIHGAVSSVLEAAKIRSALGAGFLIVTPGIRGVGTDVADQTRVASAAAAAAAGADYLVVGRPVTRAPDPRAALVALQAEVDSAVPA